MSRPHLWGVVLAGGEGVRLRALSRRICGDERPKQYVPVLGDRTLLGQTLDRVALEPYSAATQARELGAWFRDVVIGERSRSA